MGKGESKGAGGSLPLKTRRFHLSFTSQVILGVVKGGVVLSSSKIRGTMDGLYNYWMRGFTPTIGGASPALVCIAECSGLG